MRFAKNTQHDASKVLRLPRKMTMDHVQSAAPATKTATHLLKTSQKYCACHTNWLSTRYKARLNVTKSHACHAKPSNATLETSKNYQRHGHIAIARTVANGCGRLGNGNPCYAFGKEGKGRERKGTGQEGKGWERKGKKGKERERKGKDWKGRERKGKEEKERERKGKKGKERERKGKKGKGREGKERLIWKSAAVA